ncbi:MAG: PKD domain-containing protein [Microbacteriaceae bacterium]
MVPGRDAAIDTDVLIYSSATRHSKLRNLLGYDTLIRFTPESYRWTFGDGVASTSSRIKHRYPRVGKYFLRLSVTYQIAIRVLPSGRWVSTPLRIKKVADPKSINITQERIKAGIPVLVNRNCLQHPSAIGC